MGHIRADQHEPICLRGGAGTQRGAWQPSEGGACWTLVCSADDALIQFLNSVLHLGYADREYPAAKQEKNPQIYMLGGLHQFLFSPV